MSSELIRVSRPILKPDHQRLRSNIPRANRLGDLSIKWRRLGETGITLMERGEYEQRLFNTSSKLPHQDLAFISASLKNAVTAIDGSSDRITAPITNVDFMGNGPYLSIAYILKTEQASRERTVITNHMDVLSGVDDPWREFESHVSIATIPAANAQDDILDAFWKFAPSQLTFLGIDVATD